MTQKQRVLLLAATVAGLVACGGGGQSGEPNNVEPVVAGSVGPAIPETESTPPSAGSGGDQPSTASPPDMPDGEQTPSVWVFSSDASRMADLAPQHLDNFGSGAVFNDTFTGDPDYAQAIQVASGEGFGAGVHVGFVAFTGYAAGFAQGFDQLNFKIKASGDNLRAFEIKFFLPDNARQYDLTQAGAIATPIGNGWLQVAVPLAGFVSTLAQNDGFLIGPFGQQANRFSYLLTDISFSSSESNSAGSTAPPGSGDAVGAGGLSDDGAASNDGSADEMDGNNTGDDAGDAGSTGGGEEADGGLVGPLPVKPLFDQNTPREPIASMVRDDGVVVTRFGDRGRDRHAKDNGPNDHYDHYLAHYWQYRTARVQFEDHTRNGQSLIRATYITEEELGAREFRVWFWGVTTSAQFHLNPAPTYLGRGTWNDNFVKVSNAGHQHMYRLDITTQWQNGGQFQNPLRTGMNMEFEISQFLRAPPAGARRNYYGTTFVYVVGQPGLAPFEWQRGQNKPGGSNDGTPLPSRALLGGDGTLGYNYSAEPAGRFMQMVTSPRI